uniref:E3 SUMO-protein ligase PIAS3 n=2 Tax=Cacopsylla melanoneura TaxID=428564 RepID=A0A8D8V156_9HEMI
MSHQMPFYTSQRLQQQQQQQKQMQQQAAVLAMQNQQQQNHMYQPGAPPHYYMRPPTNPAVLGPKLPDRHPLIKYKVLPFFDIKHELIGVSSLQPTNTSSRNQEVSFQFKLTNQQAAELGENREIIPGVKNDWHYQIQLRIAALNTSTEQDDHYPPNLGIKVNQRAVQLPNPIPSRVQNKEPIRPSRPLNISPLCKICPFVMNIITVNWTYEFNNNDFYVIKVEIVKKLTSSDLLDRLKSKGIKPVEYTTKIIRDKLNETDCEIATDTLQVNLACPLSRTRMTIPCRASTCTHLQCFDAITYLQMNEKKQTWVCPVCNQSCQYGSLFIDGYFLQVLESYKDGSEIILTKDGSWTGYVPPKDEHKGSKSANAAAADVADLSIVCLDDDDPVPSTAAATTKTASVIKNGAEVKTSGISIPIPPAAAGPPPPPPGIEEIFLG